MNKPWKMPAWMEPYREMIQSSGHRVEDLVNDDGTNSNVFNNAPRALICVGTKDQVALLERLHEAGKI